jgi:hypothetical protein
MGVVHGSVLIPGGTGEEVGRRLAARPMSDELSDNHRVRARTCPDSRGCVSRSESQEHAGRRSARIASHRRGHRRQPWNPCGVPEVGVVGAELVIHGRNLRRCWAVTIGHDHRLWRFDCSISSSGRSWPGSGSWSVAHDRRTRRFWCCGTRWPCCVARCADHDCRGRIERWSRR